MARRKSKGPDSPEPAPAYDKVEVGKQLLTNFLLTVLAADVWDLIPNSEVAKVFDGLAQQLRAAGDQMGPARGE